MPRRPLLGNWFEEEAYENDKRKLRQQRMDGTEAGSVSAASGGGGGGSMTLGQRIQCKLDHHRIPYPLFGKTVRSAQITVETDDKDSSQNRQSEGGSDVATTELQYYTPFQLLNVGTMGVLALDLDDRKLGSTGWKIRCTTTTTDTQPMLRNVFVIVPVSTSSGGALVGDTLRSSVYGTNRGEAGGAQYSLGGTGGSSAAGTGALAGSTYYSSTAGKGSAVLEGAMQTHAGATASTYIKDRLMDDCNEYPKRTTAVASVWRQEQQTHGDGWVHTVEEDVNHEQLTVHYGECFRIQTVPELLPDGGEFSGPLFLASEKQSVFSASTLSAAAGASLQEVYLTPDVSPATLWRFEFAQKGYREDAKGFPVREQGMKVLVHNATSAPLCSLKGATMMTDFGVAEHEVGSGSIQTYASRRRAAPEGLENSWMLLTGTSAPE